MRVQPARRRAPVNHGRGNSEITDPPEFEDRMLIARQSRHQGVRPNLGERSTHIVGYSPSFAHLAIVTPKP